MMGEKRRVEVFGFPFAFEPAVAKDACVVRPKASRFSFTDLDHTCAPVDGDCLAVVEEGGGVACADHGW
jgi:hypothetical protein